MNQPYKAKMPLNIKKKLLTHTAVLLRNFQLVTTSVCPKPLIKICIYILETPKLFILGSYVIRLKVGHSHYKVIVIESCRSLETLSKFPRHTHHNRRETVSHFSLH